MPINLDQTCSEYEKGLVTNIDSNNLVPSFVGVDAWMHILCDCDRIFMDFQI